MLFVGIAVYAILFVSVSLYVFVENDESQPLSEIFQWGFLIPVAFCSLFSLWVSFGLFLFLNKIFSYFTPNKIATKAISFPLSLIVGIPAGLIMLDRMIRLITA